MTYITGDTHGEFSRIGQFCEEENTTKDDVLIILGDVGVNFAGGEEDEKKKGYLESLPITIFGIHGNHERRPWNVTDKEGNPCYHETKWHGGTVFVEDTYPSILLAKDGEFFDFDCYEGPQRPVDVGSGRTGAVAETVRHAIVIGGAYSVDKFYRLKNHWLWFSDEQPSRDIKRYVELQLQKAGWKVDAVLSHTVPLKYEPWDTFGTVPGLDQSKVDRSTEEWLDDIEDALDYKKWYAGHFHIQRRVDKVQIMFEDYDAFMGYL